MGLRNVLSAFGPSAYRAPVRDVGALPVRQRHGLVELLDRDRGQVVKLVDVTVSPQLPEGRLRLKFVAVLVVPLEPVRDGLEAERLGSLEVPPDLVPFVGGIVVHPGRVVPLRPCSLDAAWMRASLAAAAS